MTKTKQIELKITNQVLATLVVFLALGLGYMISKEQGWVREKIDLPSVSQRTYQAEPVLLPQLSARQSSIFQAISKRRTRSDFLDTPITIQQLHTLLWSMQGITADWGGRAVPTIKSSYPLQVTVIARNLEGLSGIYQYDASASALLQTHTKIPDNFYREVENLTSVATAPLTIVISGDKEIHGSTLQTNTQGLMYYEAGHAVQNAFLIAESIGLGLHPTNAYDAERIQQILGLPQQEMVLSMFAIGSPKEW